MRTILTSLLAVLPAVNTLAQSVQPRQAVETELLQLRAPGLTGWQIAQKTPARVTFSRIGFGPNATLAAIAIVFRIEPPRSKEHFLEQIRAGVLADTPPDRYRQVRFDYNYEEVRGYPCVRYTAVHEDLKAKLLTPTSKVLQMQSHSLYCIYPYEGGAAFVAGYSHRGENLHSGLEVEAREFIDSVKPRAR